ncbi:MAG: hypothetical protein KA247_01915 [Bacteroidetes bacterium]|nr:hypothetical protein [Bacteroidota bacterium]
MSDGKKFNPGFLIQIFAASIVVGGLASYPLLTYGTQEIINASIIGFGLSIVNVLLGYAALEISAGRSYTVFVQIVLGGIAVRLFLMASVLLVLIWLVKVHALALVVSLFVMYVIFLGLEVLYIHNKWQAKIQQS